MGSSMIHAMRAASTPGPIMLPSVFRGSSYVCSFGGMPTGRSRTLAYGLIVKGSVLTAHEVLAKPDGSATRLFLPVGSK